MRNAESKFDSLSPFRPFNFPTLQLCHSATLQLFTRPMPQQLLILDGAMATELERHGANINDALWSARVLIENPELIRRVHLDYLQAGADIITTASYQATFVGFARRGIDHAHAAELMRRSVQLALEAREEFIAGE